MNRGLPLTERSYMWRRWVQLRCTWAMLKWWRKNSACDSVNTQSSPPDSLGSRDINVITLLEPARRQHGWKVVTGVTVDYEHEFCYHHRNHHRSTLEVRKIKHSAHHPFVYLFFLNLSEQLASRKRKKKGGGTDCFHNPLSFAYSQIIDVIYRFISLYPLSCQLRLTDSFKVTSLHSFLAATGTAAKTALIPPCNIFLPPLL